MVVFPSGVRLTISDPCYSFSIYRQNLDKKCAIFDIFDKPTMSLSGVIMIEYQRLADVFGSSIM
jgi:hypothetical protein